MTPSIPHSQRMSYSDWLNINPYSPSLAQVSLMTSNASIQNEIHSEDSMQEPGSMADSPHEFEPSG